MMKTPEGWSWEWVERAKKGDFSGRQYVKDIIREAQAEAVAGERERCVNICENAEMSDVSSASALGKAIAEIREGAAEREAPNED